MLMIKEIFVLFGSGGLLEGWGFIEKKFNGKIRIRF